MVIEISINETHKDTTIYYAGVEQRDGRLVNSGGRVLGVTALARDLATARELTYQQLACVNFKNSHFRKDIALEKDNHTRFAIFASGNGSNAQNIIEYLRGSRSLEVSIVITDNPDAYVIQRCLHLGVDYKVIPFSKEKGKAIHESEIIEVLKTYHVKWILLAGYMRILSSQFLSLFHDGSLSEARVVNIHPSLLPQYPGLNSYERAF
ncbi:formyltransferase family protein, partial [Bacteriovorax sp. DB6_IX]|uniref:formyltransferase family protein n=1 Tax=Bacteriovorax sp. DB6_IX TaxID=1353530 RepID=UPI00038A3D7C